MFHDDSQGAGPTQLEGGDLELLSRAAGACEDLRQQVAQVIIGQNEVVQPLLATLFADGHSLLIGVPGLAKTLLARTLADALGWRFRRIQFTPDMMPSDITGTEVLEHTGAGDAGRRMRFVPGPVFCNFLLADEINRTPPKTQAALLEAMQERTVTSLGHTHPIDRPFAVVATQNPIEQEGTYPLPEAQLDRFMISLWMDYPSVEEEEEIVHRTTRDDEPTVRPVLGREEMLTFQHLVRRVPATRYVVSYAVALARATRPNRPSAADVTRDYVEWGAGPRAAQYMVLLGKALAVTTGQPAVTAAHIRQAAPWVLRHRVIPNYRATGEGMTSLDIIGNIIESVRAPIG